MPLNPNRPSGTTVKSSVSGTVLAGDRCWRYVQTCMVLW